MTEEELQNHTRHLTPSSQGKLWSVYCKYFRENSPYHNGTALYYSLSSNEFDSNFVDKITFFKVSEEITQDLSALQSTCQPSQQAFRSPHLWPMMNEIPAYYLKQFARISCVHLHIENRMIPEEAGWAWEMNDEQRMLGNQWSFGGYLLHPSMYHT